MAEVDFSDFDSAKAWFETQSVEARCAMSSRAALRVFANFRGALGGMPDDLDMAVLRAILTSAGRGSGRPTPPAPPRTPPPPPAPPTPPAPPAPPPTPPLVGTPIILIA